MDHIQIENIEKQFQFHDSVFPTVIKNNGRIKNLEDCELFIDHHKKKLENILENSGVVLFRDFPIDSVKSFDRFYSSFKYKNFTYQDSLSNAVRINFSKRVFTANEAPQDVEIFLHHEMAQTPKYPDKLFFFCLNPAEQGGATPICRSDKLFEAIEEIDPSITNNFIKKGVKYTTIIPFHSNPLSGQGRSWQSTLNVETTQEAEEKLRELEYSWQWLKDKSLKVTTPILPAVMKLHNGKKVFFNQLIAAYLGWKGVKEDPSKSITYGDGSPIDIEALNLAVKLSKQLTFDLIWKQGDVAIIDNHMAMHGRKKYSGNRKREVLVALSSE